MDFKIPKTTSIDTCLPTRPHRVIFPKQFRYLRPKYSNTYVYWSCSHPNHHNFLCSSFEQKVTKEPVIKEFWVQPVSLWLPWIYWTIAELPKLSYPPDDRGHSKPEIPLSSLSLCPLKSAYNVIWNDILSTRAYIFSSCVFTTVPTLVLSISITLA